MGYKWVWRLSLTDKVTASVLGDFVKKNPKWNRVAFLHENTDYGRPPILIMSKIIKEAKGKKQVALETYNKGDTDLSAQLMKIKKAKPDVVFTWGYYTEAALIARQAQQIGLKAQLFGNQALGFPEYINLAGGAAEGVMYADSTSGAYNPDPKIVALKEKYEKRVKASFYNSVTDGYDGATIIGQVFKKVGTDAKKVQKALNTRTFQGVAEKIKFDAKGQAQKGLIILKVKGGRWVLHEKVL
jgi:branched-chain amino acid transport system substrate-binding protein